jgi:hypothetical protein
VTRRRRLIETCSVSDLSLSYPPSNVPPMTEIDQTYPGFAPAWSNDHVEILIDQNTRNTKAMLVFPWFTSKENIRVGVERAQQMGFDNILAIGNIEHTVPGQESESDCDYYLMGVKA